jgi:hypothetical protein
MLLLMEQSKRRSVEGKVGNVMMLVQPVMDKTCKPDGSAGKDATGDPILSFNDNKLVGNEGKTGL